MNKPRPKNLNLFTIHFPIPAIVSILHRLSGVVLFFIIPFFLWALQVSLMQQGFENMQTWLTSPYVRFLIWLCFIPFCYHLIAGIRHLLMDVGLGVTLEKGKKAAALTIIVSAALIILAGIWLW